jgi:hypothetical protein
MLTAQQGQASKVQGTSKRLTFEKRRWTHPECSNSIRDQGLKEQLLLGSKRTVTETHRKPLGLEIAKQVVGLLLGCGE